MEVSTWVMSCRAFSRRIEFHTLEYLFKAGKVENIALSFQPTERNQPLQEFLRSSHPGTNGAGGWILTRGSFMPGENDLPHRVSVIGESSLEDSAQNLHSTIPQSRA
jgi:hypothetical protein